MNENIERYTHYYFIGIGGIGMSNLVRYFLANGKTVGGYDRVQTPLTDALTKEGAIIHYADNIDAIPLPFFDKEHTLVVYTPAISFTHSELNFFRSEGFVVVKRAQVLGEITNVSDAICIAGTHGKTTVSGMVAHLLHQSPIDCNAFLGGISKNYESNLLLSAKSRITVVEADEYDRSFLWLRPWMAIVTAADPDHLDIYGSVEAYRESFEEFTSLIRPNGYLIMKKDITVTPRCESTVHVFTYSESTGDFHAENVRFGNGEIIFDFVSPFGAITDIQLGVPVKINIENAVAAIAATTLAGVTSDEVREAMRTFRGTKRRFDVRLKTNEVVFIDDYAHHPAELAESVDSIKTLYPKKKITGVFQPHLYTRTRDFADDFAQSLSKLDEVILLDIYPAREEPIEGVSSELIFNKITTENKTLCKKSELLDILKNRNIEVLVTLGAGDIDRLLLDIEKLLKEKSEKNNPLF